MALKSIAVRRGSDGDEYRPLSLTRKKIAKHFDDGSMRIATL
jgi:hypothetical protein